MYNRLNRPIRVAAAITLTAALGSLSACASGSSSSGGGSGGELAVASPYPTVTLDPLGTSGADNGTLLAAKQIFSRLVDADSGKFTPSLASSWTVSPDSKTWTFTLRAAKFSDGTPVTANDVKASIAAAVAQNDPNAAMVKPATVDAVNDHTVTFAFADPTPSLLGALTQLYIVPASEADQPSAFNKPVGSGPFKVESFAPNQTVVLVPNPYYWGPAPKLKKLTLRDIPDINARVTALRTGEIQATWGVPDDQISQVKGQDGITVASTPSTAVYTMWFNSSRPSLKNAAVRKAIWQAIDFKTIISSLYPVTGSPADSPVAPSVIGYAKQSPVTYDPTAAKQALTAAGFDFSTTLRLQYSGDDFTQFAQAVASDLAKIGVKVDPVEKEKSVWLSDLLALNFDINLQALSTPTQDASTNIGRLYTCAAKRTGYCDSQLDALLNKAASTPDADARSALYGQAESVIWNQAVGMYPMFVRIVYAESSTVHNLPLDPNYVPSFAATSVQ
jgi:peptide/nickel transport system substrate-binding protein